MMTRCLSLFAALAVAVGLGACGDNSSTPPPAPAKPATTTVKTETVKTETVVTSDEATTQAQKLLDQATTYIKENKVDLADKTIVQLEALKPKLPAEWQTRVDQVRSSLETLKKAGGAKIPEGVKLPG